MTSTGFATRFTLSVIATLALANLAPSPARAEEDHSHGTPAQHNPLAKMVRQSTETYKAVSAAEKAGYALAFGCVSGPASGAMGLHYVNMPLVMDGQIDAARPEIILYEPVENGAVRVVGADYMVLVDGWDKY